MSLWREIDGLGLSCPRNLGRGAGDPRSYYDSAGCRAREISIRLVPSNIFPLMGYRY